MNKRNLIPFTAITVCLLIISWFVGGWYSGLNAEPESEPVVVTETVYIDRPVVVTEYVDRWQTVTVTEHPAPEIVTEYVPVELKQFENLQELKGFVDGWKASGFIAVSTDHQCEVYALALQEAAARAGYVVNFQITGNHAHNSAIVGNDIYFIEPQTAEVWKWGELE